VSPGGWGRDDDDDDDGNDNDDGDDCMEETDSVAWALIESGLDRGRQTAAPLTRRGVPVAASRQGAFDSFDVKQVDLHEILMRDHHFSPEASQTTFLNSRFRRLLKSIAACAGADLPVCPVRRSSFFRRGDDLWRH
jgi:hypothetical protein